MKRFLIEVPHGSDPQACTRAIEVFLRTGSHFLTHAEWGCKDDVHKAWLIVEVDSHNEARNIVPADYRKDATVVQLGTFSLDDIHRAPA